VDTYHDRVRETVLEYLEGGRSKTLHLRLAEVIEQGAGSDLAQRVAAMDKSEEEQGITAIPRVYDLAFHFDAAAERQKAGAYALLAAEQAKRQSALEVAANNYAIARRNTDAKHMRIRYRIAIGYGDALMLLGRYAEATLQLDGAIDVVEEAEKKARVELLQGEIAVKLGLMDRSIAIYENGLRRLGVWVPRSRFGFMFGVLRQTLVQVMHTLMPFLLNRKVSTEQRNIITRFFCRLSHPYMFQSILKAVWAHFTGMNRAEKTPPSYGLCFNYTFHCCVMSMVGLQRRGSRYGDRAINLANQLNDLWLRGQTFNYKGIGSYASALYEEGVAVLTEAIAAFEKAGDLWEVNLAHFHKGCCYFGLGNLAEAAAEARWAFESSARLGDSRTMCASWLWARATKGNLPFEELRSCLPCRPDDVMSTAHGVMAEGLWHRFHGRTGESLKAFESAREMVGTSFCWNSHMILTLPMLAGALRLHADAVQRKDPQEADRLRRRAYRLAKWATRFTRFIPAAYSLALRERSLILAAYGKKKKALKFADKSCRVAEAQKAKYEHAQSLLLRGKLAKELGLPEAEEQIRAAEAALEAIEKPVQQAAVGAQPWPSTPGK
jgi:eukaryotic-like serine/threonine-protein kinase